METFRFLLFGFAGVSVVFWVAIITLWHAYMFPRFFNEDKGLNSVINEKISSQKNPILGNLIKSNNFKKYLLLGDMLEHGTHSKKLHQSIVPIINKTKIDKIFLKGNYISKIFKKIVKSKRGKVFRTNSQMIKFIKNDLNNNDYLMVKASNATGFNKMINDLKGIK